MIEIICADARDALAAMPDGSVHACITSPPYWGLRDYGLEPQVWGPECEHEWGEEMPGDARGGSGTPTDKNNRGEGYGRDVARGAFCRRCNAWRGTLGLEPTPELYVEHLVAVMREVKRVLRDDGTCWINLGDSYSSGVVPESDIIGHDESEDESALAIRGNLSGVRTEDGSGAGEGAVSELLQQGDEEAHLFGPGQAGTQAPQGSRVLSGEQRALQREDSGATTGSTPKSHEQTRWQVSLLRRETADIPDARPRKERWEPSEARGATPDIQKGRERRLSRRQVSSPLLELQRSEGIGRLPPPKRKDLVGIPWLVAFALRADGWYLRMDIVWSKPNPMPESVRDRPTRAHEYVFLLAKSARYYYDADAIREPCESGPSDVKKMLESRERIGGIHKDATDPLLKASSLTNIGRKRSVGSPSGRNKRSVWEIATQPYPGAHFAVFPEKLVEPCILAGTSEWGCCPECRAPWERVVEQRLEPTRKAAKTFVVDDRDANADANDQGSNRQKDGHKPGYIRADVTLGWRSTCDHQAEPVPCRVLDPFAGSGTVGLVAERLGRHSVLIDASEDYCEMARERTAQIGLFLSAK